MANIYLLRHGKVSGEAALYGHTDVEVSNEKNQNILVALAKQNLLFNKVVSSPLKRCQKLAELIAKEQSCEIAFNNRFKEMHFGQYDGIPFDDLYQDKTIWPLFEKFWENPVQHPLPKAELLTGFSYRVIEAWNALITDISHEASQNDNILVVCHGGVIRMILAHLLNIDFRNPHWYTQLSIANGSLTSIEVQQNNTRVKEIAKPLIIEHKNDKNLHQGEHLVSNVFPQSLLKEKMRLLQGSQS